MPLVTSLSSSSATRPWPSCTLAAAPSLSRAQQQRRIPRVSPAAAVSSRSREEGVTRSTSPPSTSTSLRRRHRCLSLPPAPFPLSRRPSLIARAFSDDEDEEYDVELDGEGFFGVSFS